MSHTGELVEPTEGMAIQVLSWRRPCVMLALPRADLDTVGTSQAGLQHPQPSGTECVHHLKLRAAPGAKPCARPQPFHGGLHLPGHAVAVPP